MSYTPLSVVPNMVACRLPFRGNSMSADTYQPHESKNGYGRLTGEDLERWRNDVDRMVYIVRSYATPIAWVLDNGVTYRVKQRFSVTTSKHQGRLYLLGGEEI